MPFNTTVNRVFLLGKVSDDPSSAQKGNKLLLCFTLSTTEEIRKGNSLFEHIELHHVVIPAEIVSDMLLRKGMWVYIQGRIQTRPVLEGGVKLYRTEIWSTNLEIIKTKCPATDVQYNKF